MTLPTAPGVWFPEWGGGVLRANSKRGPDAQETHSGVGKKVVFLASSFTANLRTDLNEDD